jgi:hypothetical protein
LRRRRRRRRAGAVRVLLLQVCSAARQAQLQGQHQPHRLDRQRAAAQLRARWVGVVVWACGSGSCSGRRPCHRRLRHPAALWHLQRRCCLRLRLRLPPSGPPACPLIAGSAASSAHGHSLLSPQRGLAPWTLSHRTGVVAQPDGYRCVLIYKKGGCPTPFPPAPPCQAPPRKPRPSVPRPAFVPSTHAHRGACPCRPPAFRGRPAAGPVHPADAVAHGPAAQEGEPGPQAHALQGACVGDGGGGALRGLT